ncbi:hypothetical protein [Anaerosacchariphilus polymeriproducens]|uniref:Uncharacterized protein n=1 Tax=Anaerosacchariphilus polymeriproducens TaxID=1812858 RepID=A0A371AZH6_9FIRM|nr:hypothetical protein [Anaerosacchariphilus polymeriproducens]RDU24957.1 hypothetical protein DWV06_01640 [Anaerosacchariphilus polymeriproducens]
MKKKLFSLFLTIILFNLTVISKSYAATEYTTLSQGNDFLYQIASYSEAAKALEIYKKFEAGITTQGFNYDTLVKDYNMIPTGVINSDINQGGANVGYVMSRIEELFKNNLKCILDNNTLNVFHNIIQTGFNAGTSKENYVIFSRKSGKSHTYVFKLLAGSLKKEGNKTKLTIVPAEITVNVKISVKRIFGIKIKNSKHYDVHVNANSYVYQY